MYRLHKILSFAAWVVLVGFVSCPILFAFQDETVQKLIDQLGASDERSVMTASKALEKMGASIAPQLVDALRDRKGCQSQWVISGVLARLIPGHPLENETLRSITVGKCKMGSARDENLRREAASVLAGKADEMPFIAGLLHDKDLFTGRSAAFAFNDLSKRFAPGILHIALTPELLDSTTRAFPVLADAMSDKDQVVRCMSYEALIRASRSQPESLRAAATESLAGRTLDCEQQDVRAR